VCEAARRAAGRRVTNEAHDTDERSVLTEYLRDLIHTVTVLGEHDHPRARLAIAAVVIKLNEMVKDDLLQFSQLGMSDRQ